MMSDHIDIREMSALLDEGVAEGETADHLEACAACRREMELLRRTRMALSALDDLDPPTGQWHAIEATLERRGVVEPTAGPGGGGAAEPGDRSASPGPGDAPGRRRPADPNGAWAALLPGGAGWLRAAAAVLLFAGGVGAGLTLGTGSAGSGGPSPAEDGSGEVAAAAAADREATGGSPARAGGQRPPGLTSAGDGGPAQDGSGAATEEGYRRALDRLEALRAQGPDPREVYRNPEAAAEHLARLDALIRASREALREDPTDPAVNDFLFEVVEQRQELNQALQLASLEYK